MSIIPLSSRSLGVRTGGEEEHFTSHSNLPHGKCRRRAYKKLRRSDYYISSYDLPLNGRIPRPHLKIITAEFVISAQCYILIL